MNKHLSITIEWYGPYSRDNAAEAAREFKEGIYLAIGKVKSQKAPSCLQYVGITDNLRKRLSESHYQLDQLTQEQIIWIGEITSYEPPGKKEKQKKTTLDLAEWAYVYFLEPMLNEKKSQTPPPHSVTVLNKWWKTDFESPRLQRPNQDIPDLIDFNGVDYGARLVWFGGKVVKWSPADF